MTVSARVVRGQAAGKAKGQDMDGKRGRLCVLAMVVRAVLAAALAVSLGALVLSGPAGSLHSTHAMLAVAAAISTAAGVMVWSLIPIIAVKCAAARLQGNDLNKASKPPVYGPP